ncbi:MAG: CCA tRNA nucleotidyltransferase [Acidimicrobiia bacterium]|nr:CCA tRNA nucleotidyltransferase [Acidimicrobiia bacterium]
MIPPRLEPLLRDDAPPASLARAFGEAGYTLYLVGGSVRDALLGRINDAPDLDFTTDARPDQIKAIAGAWADDLYLVGEQFGTIGAIKDGAILEITTFRSEIYRDDSRKPHVAFGDAIEGDLARRDFAVNAMALRLPAQPGDEPEMVDPHGGLRDLFEKVLRTPLDPEIAFGDDPLRMLRLFRFQSTLGFEPDNVAFAAAGRMRERLRIVSAERIRDEFSKLMLGAHVGDALRGLVSTGLADEFIPEVSDLASQHDPLHRHKDVLAHSIAVVEKTRRSSGLELRLAALFHDIGKPATRAFVEGGVTFHHHEVVGARMTRKRMRDLRFTKQQVSDVGQLVFLHMRPHTFKMGWTDSAVRRYVRDAGHLLEQLNELVRCDVTTRNAKRARAIQRRIDELEDRIVELRKQEAIDALRPPIDGHQVIAHLGVEPGPIIGDAMRMLLEHRIEEGPYEPDEAYRLLDEWMERRETGV